MTRLFDFSCGARCRRNSGVKSRPSSALRISRQIRPPCRWCRSTGKTWLRGVCLWLCNSTRGLRNQHGLAHNHECNERVVVVEIRQPEKCTRDRISHQTYLDHGCKVRDPTLFPVTACPPDYP